MDLNAWKVLIIVFMILAVVSIMGIIVATILNSKGMFVSCGMIFFVFLVGIFMSVRGYNVKNEEYKIECKDEYNVNIQENKNESKDEVIYYLASFKDGEKLEGNHWLHSKISNGRQVYEYYIVSDIGYQLKSSYVTSDTYIREIKENQNIKPCYIKEKNADSSNWNYVFYIPEGSLFN